MSLAELSESEDESDPLDEEEEEPELEPELLELLLPLLLALGRGLGGMVGSEPMPQLWIFLISSKRKNVSLRAAVLQGFASFLAKSLSACRAAVVVGAGRTTGRFGLVCLEESCSPRMRTNCLTVAFTLGRPAGRAKSDNTQNSLSVALVLYGT